jgi:hypothetical protein
VKKNLNERIKVGKYFNNAMGLKYIIDNKLIRGYCSRLFENILKATGDRPQASGHRQSMPK